LHGRLLYGEANLKRSQGAYNEAAALYENLISLVEQVKGQVDSNAQRSLSETYGFIYDELIEAIYTRNVGAAERDLARTAAEAFTEIRTLVQPNLPQALAFYTITSRVYGESTISLVYIA
jgi:hypothetical protein